MQDRKVGAGGGGGPLTARSVLASTLLGVDPPELPVAHLVRVAGLFGINENRARVALSRMVASGEATTGGGGRYRLAGHLLVRQARQAASRAGHSGAWSGAWHLVIVAPAPAAADVRGRRRGVLTRARLAELRQGVWLRPDNLRLDLGDLGAPGTVVFTGRSAAIAGATTDDAGLAASLWDLGGWAATARRLLADLDALAPSGPEVLAPGFVLSAAVLRHFQADPLLPAALLPAQWPGEELRAVYDGWDARYRSVLVEWTRSA